MNMSSNNGTLEFDINKLSPGTNRKLEKYVDECIKQMESDQMNNTNDNPGLIASQGIKGSQVYGGPSHK
jgi:hypothetical protein